MTQRRLHLGAIAASVALLGWNLQPPYIYAELFEAVPRLWQFLFLSASVAIAAWALLPRSRVAYIVSALLLATAVSSRALAFVFVAQDLAPAFGYVLILLMASYVWPEHRARVLAEEGWSRAWVG